MTKKTNSVAKKIFCHPSQELPARQFRSHHHPDFAVIVDKNANPNWLYIVLANGKIYHHFVGFVSEGKKCHIH